MILYINSRKRIFALYMSKNTQFWTIMGLAALLVAVKGSGTGDMISHINKFSFESSAVYASVELPPSQLMDLNMIGEHWSGTKDLPLALTTSQSTYLIPKTPVLATIFDEEERTEITEYEVQPGDVLSGVASDFGVTMQTIISANKISNVDSMKPG